MTDLVAGIVTALGIAGIIIGVIAGFSDPTGFAVAGGGLFVLCAGLGLNALADIRKSLRELIAEVADESVEAEK